jgi:hypothetical protein
MVVSGSKYLSWYTSPGFHRFAVMAMNKKFWEEIMTPTFYHLFNPSGEASRNYNINTYTLCFSIS